MNRTDLVARRLHNQKLYPPDCRKPVEVVRWFGAVQSQDFEAAKWALALRMRSATNEAIEDAFNCGAILRTHVMRPTWHFVAADDIRWLLELTAPRVDLRCGPGYRKSELDHTVFKRSHKILERALRDGKYLSRSELRRKLNEQGVEANDTVRMGHILIRAELDRVVCSGPRIGKQLTYALFNERVPATKTIDRDEALARLTRLYFRSHGPATLQDFVWWSGLNITEAKQGLELVKDNFLAEKIGDQTYWLPKSFSFPAKKHSAVYLLPSYDEYIIRYKDRSAVISAENAPTAISNNGIFWPVIIINGKAAGVWKRTIKKDKTIVETEFFKAPPQTIKKSLNKAERAYRDFVGR